jgi:anti-sigma factor RsiW
MNAESQHLDFLISQYVDGTLEVNSKKSVEQKMLTDPEARRLYAEHREAQDLLDDFGSRIPLINWGEFDQQLEARLETEAREKQRVSIFRRRLRPVAAAAALAIAATLGYAWHAYSNRTVERIAQTPTTVVPAGGASNNVVILDAPVGTRASFSGMRVVEAGVQGVGSVEGVAFGAPADQVALQALQTNVGYGFKGLFGSMIPQSAPGSAVSGSSRPLDDPDPFR